MKSDSAIPSHLHSLDALRGIAALAVVVYHYAQFFTVGTVLPPSFVHADMPFYRFAPVIFDDGRLAVDLFFTLSGFVFFWLYSTSINDRSLSAGRFALLRLSRLYPLHLVTLLIVAFEQWLYWATHSSNDPFFLVQWNDAYHFVLQLGLASNWFPNSGFSFNSPAWSISIEVLLYAMFFALCRVTRIRPWMSLVMAALGLWCVYRYHDMLGRGIGSFFLGGATFMAYAKLVNMPSRVRWTCALAALTLAVWVVGILGVSSHWAFLPPGFERKTRYFPVIFMFPLIVLTLAMTETLTGMGKRFARLGDISYSTYLLHFPLQLAFLLCVDLSGMGRATFYSPWAFILYFAILIPLASASFKYFERPMQRALRNLEGVSLSLPRPVR